MFANESYKNTLRCGGVCVCRNASWMVGNERVFSRVLLPRDRVVLTHSTFVSPHNYCGEKIQVLQLKFEIDINNHANKVTMQICLRYTKFVTSVFEFEYLLLEYLRTCPEGVLLVKQVHVQSVSCVGDPLETPCILP